MTPLTDRFGNPVSTRNRHALDLYDRAVSELNSYRIDPVATIDAALTEETSFVMGHCFKAGLLLTTTERGAEPAIAAALGAAELHLAHATDRELAHLEAARTWLAGDFAESMRLYGEIAADHPRDLFAVQIAHLGDFFLGQSNMLRDRPMQVLSAWSAREPGYGVLLGMRAFGLEECGLYAEAERVGQQAVEMNAADAWAVHAVAHVYEMQGRTGAGMTWLEGTASGWSVDNFFSFHNWWHLALLHLEREDYASALSLYDSAIRPGDSQVALEMVDASALLWRLHLRGVDVGDRWQKLANAWERFGETGYYAFNDVHALMAYLCADRPLAVETVLRGLEAAAQRRDTNGMMSREVGLPLACALEAFQRGDYTMAIDDLTRVRGIAQRFGGSHAQRDLIQLTLCESALRAGRRSFAQGLVAERLALKPESPFNRRLLTRAAVSAQPSGAAAA